MVLWLHLRSTAVHVLVDLGDAGAFRFRRPVHVCLVLGEAPLHDSCRPCGAANLLQPQHQADRLRSVVRAGIQVIQPAAHIWVTHVDVDGWMDVGPVVHAIPVLGSVGGRGGDAPSAAWLVDGDDRKELCLVVPRCHTVGAVLQLQDVGALNIELLRRPVHREVPDVDVRVDAHGPVRESYPGHVRRPRCRRSDGCGQRLSGDGRSDRSRLNRRGCGDFLHRLGRLGSDADER